MSRFRFVADHRHAYSVKRLCEVLEIARSSFYAWLDGEPRRAQRATRPLSRGWVIDRSASSEVDGGVALIFGLGVPVVGVLMALNMLGAWVLVHPSALYAADHTGPETVIAIGLLSLVLAVTGSGRFGLDHLIVRRAARPTPPPAVASTR